MLNDEVIELLTERLVNRIEKGNTYILKSIAGNIKKLGGLSPSKAQQLAQILKYGGDYEKIAKKLADILYLNVNDIYKIFEEVAKKDQQFAKQFYEYRNKKFIPYKDNYALQNQIRSMARQTAETYINMSNTTAIGFGIRNPRTGRINFKGLKQAYYDAIDQAVLSVGQGKDTFDNQIQKIIKEYGGSGIKTMYQSGTSRRLDSAVRMNIQGALRDMHNDLQKQFGEEFESDGVEISVHINPAEDHQHAQGRQFTNNEWNNLRTKGVAKDYEGKTIDIHQPLKKGISTSFRPISEWNCYHYIFSIILGINKPEYNEKQLQEIIDKNNKGFEYEGKHYSMYEGTQLQRKIETEIRKAKDEQIMARAGGDEELIQQSQSKINTLTQKYRSLNNVSGLKPKMDRLRVSGYHRVKAE